MGALLLSCAALSSATPCRFIPALSPTPLSASTGMPIQRGTRFIPREFVRSPLVNLMTKLTRNQSIDLLHAVVPVSYCDLVLLDNHLETQVDRVRSRLVSAGIRVPVAKVFSGKRDGITRFLNDLGSS